MILYVYINVSLSSMKYIIVILVALFSSLAQSENIKLGSNPDPIRQGLFGTQSLAEQIKRLKPEGEGSPFHTIAEAYALKKSGSEEQAISLLRNLLKDPDIETRVRLWVWSGLRELGESPQLERAHEALGVVIEMPSGDGFDTLAAYVDGSARYLNFSGRAIFWDAYEDEIVKDLCRAVIDSTIPDRDKAKLRKTLDLPKWNPQVTILTRSGAFVITSPSESIINSGALLMIELIKRVENSED